MWFRLFAVLSVTAFFSLNSASAQICPQIFSCSPSEIAAVAPDCRAAAESSCQRAELHALKLEKAELETMVQQLQEQTSEQAKVISRLTDLVRKLKKVNRRTATRR
jgi:hypothetical protein